MKLFVKVKLMEASKMRMNLGRLLEQVENEKIDIREKSCVCITQSKNKRAELVLNEAIKKCRAYFE